MANKVAALVMPGGCKSTVGYIDTAALQQTADFALNYGLLEKAATVSKCINTKYWEQAAAKLQMVLSS